MRQRLKDLYGSVSHYFSNDQDMMLQSHGLINYLFRVQERPKDFNITEYKS